MAEGIKYVVHGMKAECSEGTMQNYINADVGHGVLYQEQPLLNANDHEPQKNLTHFGDCNSRKIFEEAKKQADEKYKAEEGDGFFASAGKFLAKTAIKSALTAKELFSVRKCELDTPLPWMFCNMEHMIDGAPALTMESQCPCRYGGIIKIVQEEEAAEEALVEEQAETENAEPVPDEEPEVTELAEVSEGTAPVVGAGNVVSAGLRTGVFKDLEKMIDNVVEAANERKSSYFVASGSILIVRDQPSVSGQEVHRLKDGNSIKVVLDETTGEPVRVVDEEGRTWIQVYYNGNLKGWVAEEYILPNQPIVTKPPAEVKVYIDGVIKTLHPREGDWAILGALNYKEPSVRNETGRYRVGVGPRVINPKYPDTGKAWKDEFTAFKREMEAILIDRQTGEEQKLLCYRADIKAHTYNKYPDGHEYVYYPPREGVAEVENGIVQTGIAYPNSSNAKKGAACTIDHADGSVIEFCGLDNEENKAIVSKLNATYILDRIIVYPNVTEEDVQ